MNRDKRKMNGTGGNLMKDGKHTVLSSSSVEPEADVTGHSLVFRRVIVTHFLSPSFPHVLHSSLHCVSRLVTLRSEDGNVSDGR